MQRMEERQTGQEAYGSGSGKEKRKRMRETEAGSVREYGKRKQEA